MAASAPSPRRTGSRASARLRLAVACAFGLLAIPAAPASAEAVRPLRAPLVERGITYGAPDGLPLLMDVRRPRSSPAAGAPAILLVHGGGFHSGHRRRMAGYARALTAAGLVTATIEYRLRPQEEVRRLGLEGASDLAQADAESAVRYLRANAAPLGIDPARILIGGASAGAITALNVAARATGPARVRAAVSIAGFGPVGDLGPTDPPLLLVHGTADHLAPIGRARETCIAATIAGEPCELIEVPGLGHRELISRYEVVSRTVVRWLRRQALL